MSSLSFHEKSAIGTLIITSLIGFFYFYLVWDLWRTGQLHPASTFGLAAGLTILLVIVLVAYHIVVAVISRPEKEDERDRLIAWRAGNIGGVLLGVGVVGIVLQILVGGLFDSALAKSPILIANVLMAAVFVATVVELVLTLVFYRRGL